VLERMFRKKSSLEKIAKILLAAAPMFLGFLGSVVWVGEPEIPTKYKK